MIGFGVKGQGGVPSAPSNRQQEIAVGELPINDICVDL